jgi:hypothetical protein
MRAYRTAAAIVMLAAGLSACGAPGHQSPTARDAADCPAAADALIRNAPQSAGDPATGTWLGQLDHLRDLARELGDVTSRQLAAELDYTGARVALDGVPPQLAIVPAQETCTVSDHSHQSAPASVIPATRAWLRANPPPARPGMTAGIITQEADTGTYCPAASHGSQVARGGGCEAWSITLTTATGAFHASCGDIAGSVACTSATAQPGAQQYFPGIGDELYVPDDGQVTAATDITIISQPPWAAWSAQASGAVGS